MNSYFHYMSEFQITIAIIAYIGVHPTHPHLLMVNSIKLIFCLVVWTTIKILQGSFFKDYVSEEMYIID